MVGGVDVVRGNVPRFSTIVGKYHGRRYISAPDTNVTVFYERYEHYVMT